MNSLISLTILLVVIYLIVTDKVDKVIASLAGALLMIISGKMLGFYSQNKAVMSIDFNTIGLLLGMMLIVSMLQRTGFFTYIAISLAKLSKGKPVLLMAFLGISTAFISMLVDNVTTVLIVAPISILVCDILGITPLPILMAEILLSNIGGVGTLIGDPPNILIGSASGYSFNDFLKHLFLPTVLTIFFSFFILSFVYKKKLSDKPKNLQAVLNIDAGKAIKSRGGMLLCLLALGITFTLFFFQERFELYPAFISLVGAGVSFFLLRPNPKDIFRDVEWDVLAFFICFFVIIGGVQQTNVLSSLAQKTMGLAKVNMTLYKVLLLWVSAVFTSFIGSVPFAMVMLPIIKSISNFGIDISRLWWVLAFGVGFGANGLPIGSAAGVLGIAISKKSRSPIGIGEWFLSGSLLTIACLIFVTLLLLGGIF